MSDRGTKKKPETNMQDAAVQKANVPHPAKPVILNSGPSENWKRYLSRQENSEQKKNVLPKKKTRDLPSNSHATGMSGGKSHKERICRPIAGASQTHKEQVAAPPKFTKVLGLDCEMVGVQDVKKSMLARVSVVNAFGSCVYDKFVQPTEPVVDYRTWVSGIRPRDLEKGELFEIVRKEVADILKGRIVVGHAVSNDFKALKLYHPKYLIRDTSKFDPFRKMFENRTPSLKALARSVLGVSIQGGEHSSVQDAKAALQLYLSYQKEWEDVMRKRKHHRKRSEMP